MNASLMRQKLLLISKNAYTNRFFGTSGQLLTVYDPARFCEPIVKMDELNKPLAADDPRQLKHMTPMKSDQTPVFYKDPIVDKMIRVMTRYDKELVRNEIYEALELVKRIQYSKWVAEKDEVKRQKIILDPIEIANLAILNIRPVMHLKKIIKVGIVYQVPYALNEHFSTFLAIKMLRDILRQKCFHGQNFFRVLLAHELIAAMNNEGFAIQAKQELHRLCEANRAFSSFRRF